MKKIFIFLLLLAICDMRYAICGFAEDKHIRVAVIQDSQYLRLAVNGIYKIIDSRSGRVLARGKNLISTAVSSKDGILVAGKNYRSDKIYIVADDPESISLNNRKFRGNIQIIKKSNLHLLAVNFIELEDYIKGILYNEISHYWPPDAIKAQAVVSRTFAVYLIQQNKNKDYDATSDIYSQVYGGRASERSRTNKAVDDTGGEVIFYQKKILPAFFHATCSGHTEDASQLWDIDLAPLSGVACGFCQESPHYHWHYVMPIQQIEELLRKNGYKNCRQIKDIQILEKNPSGRIRDLKIALPGDSLKISAKDFRNIIGPNLLRSTNFNVEIVDKDVVFEGLGWGHGVGMCQWGAYFMAKAGKDYSQIIEYYFPGTQIRP